MRYFVSSQAPDKVSAADLLADVRTHWRIENGLHFCKDRWWYEDRHHSRRPRLSACLAAVNNPALSLHRLASNPAISLTPPPTASPGTPSSNSVCSTRD